MFIAPKDSENVVRLLKITAKFKDPLNKEELKALMFINAKQECSICSNYNRKLCTNILGLNAAEVTYFKGGDLQSSEAIILDELWHHMYSLLDLFGVTTKLLKMDTDLPNRQLPIKWRVRCPLRNKCIG